MVLRFSLLLSSLLAASLNNAQELSFSDNPIYYFDGSKAVDLELGPRFATSMYPFTSETFEDSILVRIQQSREQDISAENGNDIEKNARAAQNKKAKNNKTVLACASSIVADNFEIARRNTL